MENAAKALEIAGGILIAALVVSVLIISYNNIFLIIYIVYQ